MVHPTNNTIAIIVANYDVAFAKRIRNADLRMMHVQARLSAILIRAQSFSNADARADFLQIIANESFGMNVQVNDEDTQRTQAAIHRAINVQEVAAIVPMNGVTVIA